MKRYLLPIAIAILFLAYPAKAVDFGLVSVNDTISIPLVCLDTLGKAAEPDSVHVMTWYHGQGANAFTYSARSSSPKSTSYIDTVTFAGVEYYYFIDQVGDIDSDAANGPYSGQIVLWYQSQPTANPFSFVKINDEARDLFALIDVSVSSRSTFDNLVDKVLLADNAVDTNAIADAAITAAKIAPDAIAAEEIAASAWQEMRNYIWSNIDTLSFPTDSSDFIQFLKRTIADGVWNEDTTGHYASGKYGYETLQGMKALPDSVLAAIDSILASVGFDSASVQAKIGSFGSSESSSTTLTLRQWLANSVGIDGVNDLHSKIDGLSLAGGGTEPETLVVMSVNDSTLIQGAKTTIRTIDQTTVRADGFATNVNGKLILDLDPDSFFVAVTANDYSMCLDTLLVAPGGGTDTLWLNRFDPGNPSTPDLCRVYGWVYDISGLPLSEVSVAAEIPPEYQPVQYSGAMITPFKKIAMTDIAGYWQIDLFPNSLLSNQNSRYSFKIEYPSGIVYKTKIEVPDLSSWQLQ